MSKTKILVSAGSKHGATAEIGTRIGEVLEQRGLDATVLEPRNVLDVDEFDAVILGSAVYAGHWVHEAKEVARLISKAAARPATWLFSSGPVGDPPKPEEDPVDVSDIIQTTSAAEHRIFSGKIDKSKLSFAERAILIAVGAPEGDYRDWDEIEEWARTIADRLVLEVSQQ